MIWRGSLLILTAVSVACASQRSRRHTTRPATMTGEAVSTVALQAAQPWEVVPYARTSEILVDGAPVGYLIEYQPIPTGITATRALPTGSYRIQGRDFEDVGFVSPRGEFHRHLKGGGSESLGNWNLETGLLRFFDGVRQVKLVPLEPTPQKNLATTAPAEGAPAAEGDAAATEEK